jgi:hypothetical protein
MRQAVAAVGVVMVAAGPTACGGSSSSGSGTTAEAGKPAATVLADSKSALFNAKAVHVTGNETAQGHSEQLDMQLQGQDSAGRLTMSGTTVQLVKSAGQLYIKAPASYWQQSAPTHAAALADKWITVPAGQTADQSLTLQGIAAALNSNDSPLMPKTQRGTVNGQKAIVLVEQNGSRFYVADSSTPVPLKIVSMGTNQSTLAFTDYGRTQVIKPPAGAVTPQQAASSGAHT